MNEIAKKIGRPLKRPPRDAVERIHALAKKAYTKHGIATELGTSPQVFNRWLKEDERLEEAYGAGREVIHHALTSKLLNKALSGEGNVVAMIFALKGMFGWREGEAVGQGNQVNLTFNIPDPMPMKEFMEMQSGSASTGVGVGVVAVSGNGSLVTQRS